MQFALGTKIILVILSVHFCTFNRKHYHSNTCKSAPLVQREMASVTMAAASLLPAGMTKSSPPTRRGGLMVAKASSRAAEGEEVMSLEMKSKEESSNGRRELVFAAAAAACSIAKVALADEPKRGTPEAKKKYAPVCVTMPTARICRK